MKTDLRTSQAVAFCSTPICETFFTGSQSDKAQVRKEQGVHIWTQNSWPDPSPKMLWYQHTCACGFQGDGSAQAHAARLALDASLKCESWLAANTTIARLADRNRVCPPWEDLGKLLFDLRVSRGSTSHLFNREMHCYVCQCVSSKHTKLATVDLEFPSVSIFPRMKQSWLTELPLRVGFISHSDLSGTECSKSTSEIAVDSVRRLNCN